MSDNLLAAAIAPAAADPAPPAKGMPPAEIPEKFWDAERQEIRLEALLKSYRELERALSRRAGPPADDAPEEERMRWRRALGIPDAPDGYEIAPAQGVVGADPEVNRRLHEAGFTPRQAQLVYDLAAERLLPLIAEAAAEFEAERQLEQLRAQFGGEERFREVARQISAWGRANLPEAVLAALSGTADGVMALHRMMQAKEPPLARQAEPPVVADEAELRRMMRDPRYWRSREPEFVKRVTDGFRRLVGGE